MRLFFAMACVLFLSSTGASGESPCDFAPGISWKVGLTTSTPGAVHIVSHCKRVGLEDLSKLDTGEATVVASWPSKIKNLDLSQSIYRYYLIVNNDHGERLEVGLSEWKVAHAHHLSVVGNGIEIPPCVVVAFTFLSPGSPRMEISHMQVSLPNGEGGWSVASQPRPIPLHVSTSPHFVRSDIRVRKLPKQDATSVACK